MTMMNRRALLSAGTAGSALALLAACGRSRAPVDMTPSKLVDTDAVGQADLIRRGEISPREAVEDALLRADRINPQINAIVTDCRDRALAQAEAGPRGPFGGVPYLIKDLLPVAGVKMMLGSRALKNFVPDTQPPLTDAIDAAGLNTFGKTATPELGFISSTEPLVTGPTRNPWNLDYIPGGSSGGAAAAVAAGIVPAAHASDGGGSIRIPASCCGLVGLKPTPGRLASMERGEDSPVRISVNGCVSRTVRDTAALFAATERTGADQEYAPIGLISDPVDRPLRIAFAPDPIVAGQVLDGEVRTAVEDTAAMLEALGHEIIPFTPDIDGEAFALAFNTLWSSAADQFVRSVMERAGIFPVGLLVEPWTLDLQRFYLALPEGSLEQAIGILKADAARYDSWFDRFDVMLTPTLCSPPARIGEQAPTLDFETLFARVNAFVGYTPVQNAAEAPAISLPLHWSASGLPIGSHLTARKGEDALLIALAYQIEQASPWIDRKPPVWAG